MANAAHDAEAARPLVSPRNQSSSTAGETRHSRGVQLALTASWVANGLLLVAKLVAFLISHSWAVLASFADSAGKTLAACRLPRALQPLFFVHACTPR